MTEGAHTVLAIVLGGAAAVGAVIGYVRLAGREHVQRIIDAPPDEDIPGVDEAADVQVFDQR
jgi:hypothetical protein